MIPVYKPWLTKLEKKYANQAIDSSWISSTGGFVNKAEELFAEFIGVKHCIVTTSGTTALHLCFRALNKSGLVFIPDTTFIASAFAASYDKRDISLIDADPDTWNINLDALDKQLANCFYPGVVMPVHLYGNPVDMEGLLELKKKYNFRIIEDACESLGASINGKMTGSFGDISCFSFYGNKTFTCLTEDMPILANIGTGPQIMAISELKKEHNISVPTHTKAGQIVWGKAEFVPPHNINKKCLEIKSKAGRSIKCSDDHQLFVYKNSRIVPVLASDLSVGDFLVAPKNIINASNTQCVLDISIINDPNVKLRNDKYIYETNKPIPGGCRKGLSRYQNIDVDLATILGFYTAEGSIGPDRLVWTFKRNETHIDELINTWSKRFPNWAISRYPKYDGSNGETILAGGKLHKAIWAHLGALGYSHEKRIPKAILSSPREVQLAYLKAYWFGDGCTSHKSGKTYIEFKTVSKWLATDLHYLLLTLGYPSTFEVAEKAKIRKFPTGRRHCRESYRIRVGDVNLVNLFTGNCFKPRGNILEHRVPIAEITAKYKLGKKILSKKSTSCYNIPGWEQHSDFAFLQITSIKEIEYNGKWYDLKVPGTNSFIAGLGAFLIHNCGEGGAVVTDDDILAERARFLRGQAQDPNKRYWHTDIGYNYRMTNVQAAILCGQLERADDILAEKERVSERYRKALEGHFKFQKVLPGHKHSQWLVTLELPVKQSIVAPLMHQAGIDVRKVFYPISEMPPYQHHATGPVSKRLSEYGISLPSYPELTNDEIDYVCDNLKLNAR